MHVAVVRQGVRGEVVPRPIYRASAAAAGFSSEPSRLR
jgi:hypothetical protein